MTDRNLAALYHDLDTAHRTTLLALADYHEERQEDRLACGYRWLVEQARWPIWHETRRVWAWPEWYSPGGKRGLPEKTWQWLISWSKCEVGCAVYEFRTLSAAFRAAAQALAETLFTPQETP